MLDDTTLAGIVGLVGTLFLLALAYFAEKNGNEIDSPENDKKGFVFLKDSSHDEEIEIPEEKEERLKFFTKRAKAHLNMVNKQRVLFMKEIEGSVKKHLKQLIAKYNQLAYYDDYDRLITDEFVKELVYFSDNVVSEEIGTDYEYDNDKLNDSYDFFEEYKDLLDDPDDDEVWDVYYDIYEDDTYLVKRENFFNFNLILNPEKELDIDFDKKDDNVHIPMRLQSNNLLEYDEGECRYRIVVILFHMLHELDTLNNKNKQKVQHAKIESTPLDYEKDVATQLKELGFTARTTKASGDQGADVLASKNGVSFAIQCKKYSKPVGNKAVQEANAGRDFYKKDYGVVVSNAGFTKSARQAANACGIILLNDNQLDKLLTYTETE